MSEQNRKRMHHWNTPGHAHELTFSCYRRREYFFDHVACEILLEEIERARKIYSFKLWAYVVMPSHVHLLLWPKDAKYDIAKIQSGIKGIMSKRYGKYLAETDVARHDNFLLKKGEFASFLFWQPGGGFDRNLWNPKAIHDSISYIEANPVRRKLASTPEAWRWSSAFGRACNFGLVPDEFHASVVMINAQAQRIGVV
jgi:putative transposase